MSISRGTCSEVAKLFKSYIRSAAKSSGSSASLSDPFLCLHIRCPEGSYDANVEPSKDDVLFEDPQILLSLAESLFKHIYGDMDSSSKDAGDARADEISASQGLTARHPTAISSPQRQGSEYTSSQGTTSRTQLSTSSPSLGSTQRTGIYDLQLQEADRASQRMTTHRDLEAANPWSIAKMNVSVCSSHDTSRNVDTSPPFLTPARGRESDRARGESTQMNRRFSGSTTLPSPSNSNSNSTSTSPSDARRSPLFIQHTRGSPTVSELNSSTRSAKDRARDRERYGNGALDTWFQKTTQLSLSRQSVEDLAVQDHEEILSEQRAAERFGPKKSQSGFTTAAALLQSTSNRFKPFKSPLDPKQTSSRQPQLLPSQDTEDYPPSPEPEQPERRHEFPVMERWSSLLHQSSTQETSSELEEALDFERRKKSAIQARRLQMKDRLGSLTQESTHSPSSSPHHNRYLAARAALNPSNNNTNTNVDADTETPTQEAEDSSSSRPPRSNPNDPRAYFIRHRELDQQTEKTGGCLMRVRRVHSSKLPLERIPEGSNLHDVGLPYPIALQDLSKSFKQGWETDSYIRSGTRFDVFSSADSSDWGNVANTWEARLSALVQEKYRVMEGDTEPELDLNLISVIKAHVDELSQD